MFLLYLRNETPEPPPYFINVPADEVDIVSIHGSFFYAAVDQDKPLDGALSFGQFIILRTIKSKNFYSAFGFIS
ncbi:hypothetical protein [Falsibacillus pallidus]|uniref:Uncharacterized protein n=1 Tax=Falsibacillus pallidus TaxID=493781 RepID=A0A370G2C6_9BACI|nr:hypothetical protein [Falsibacillus pallidus]RDI38021.1 hypothetical protein DFR59_11933 [Falsibacillus pallidus]